MRAEGDYQLGLRHSANRLYARMVNDKRRYPEYSYRWLNQFVGELFWENPGALIRPQFAWGIAFASALTRALGHDKVACIEFGVAGGRGLVAMQNIADAISKTTGVSVELYGFDTGSGL